MKCCVYFPLAVLLLFCGCSKKEAKPPTQAAADVKHAASAQPATVRPGIEFYDTGKQKRYEKLFNDYLSQFEPPAAGSSIWLKLWDGKSVGGQIQDVAPDSVSLVSTGRAERIKITDMALESRAQVFPAEFARSHAMGTMTGESPPPPDAVGASVEVRYLIGDDTPTRTGPGNAYRHGDGTHFTRGQPVNVCCEFDGWLRVADAKSPSWIPKFLTYPLDEMNRATLQADMDALSKSGLLQKMNAEKNEADIDMNIWQGTDPQLRLGVARILADFCAVARSNNLVFVTVRDAATQKKIGKYSQAQGWKDGLL